MAQPIAQPKTIQAPKTHPTLIGATFGLVVAALQVATIQLTHTVLDGNKIVGFAGSVLVPLVGLYLAGHYAGRHQRLNFHNTTLTSGLRSVLAGTGAGAITGLSYVLLTEVSVFVQKYLPYQPSSNGVFGDVLGALGNVVGFIVWLFLGLLLGTIGGYIGDLRAHQDIKKGAVVVQ